MVEIVLQLIDNVALIVLLATLQQWLVRGRALGRTATMVVTGVLYGLVGVVAMMNPLQLRSGLFYDGRSIVLAIAGLFGGPIGGSIAAVICSAYRLSVGGMGTLPGILSIVVAASMGTLIRYMYRGNDYALKPGRLLVWGMAIQALVLTSQLTLPQGFGIEVIRQIGVPTMVLFPLATVLVASLLFDQERRLDAQGRQARNEERLRLALEAANQGLYDLDLRTGQATVSPEYATMLGYDPETFAESHEAWIARMHPEERGLVDRAYHDYIEGRVSEYRTEFRQKTATGDWKWILSLGRIVERDESGAPVRMLGTHTDISDRKAAEAELEQHREHLEELVEARTSELAHANKRLREASQAKSDFLASVSHELRTPLNSIIGFSGILKQGFAGPLTEEQTNQVEIINASGKHLLALIDEVLDLSKVEAGKVQLQLEQFCPHELVQSVADMLKPLAVDKGLELRVKSDSSGGPLTSDPGKVKQILLNLVGNAVKFTDSGSIELRAFRLGDRGWSFSVTDTGPGIAWKDMPRVFEAFTQIESQHGTKPGGTGLGLALSRDYARMLGGEITLRSQVGAGSTFSLWVPQQ